MVKFDPADEAQLSTFRSKYNVALTVPVYGPYSGKLDNSDDEVELFWPDSPDEDFTPYILADKVNYQDQAPWPAAADGNGPGRDWITDDPDCDAQLEIYDLLNQALDALTP